MERNKKKPYAETARARYEKKAIYRATIPLHRVNDKDVIDKFESIMEAGESRAAYVKKLVRDDLAKQQHHDEQSQEAT